MKKEGYILKKTLGTAAVAEAVGVSKSALKHYITILEKCGYEIQRDHRNYRTFKEEDLAVFQAYRQLHNERGLTLKEAATVVTSEDFNIDEVEIIPLNQQVVINKNDSYELSRYEDLSNAMELLAEHVKGIESQNAQLLQLIQAQQQQNDLLMQQNETLKNEFSDIKLQIEAPKQSTEETDKQLERLSLQNSAIMATLNRLNVEKHSEEIEKQQQEQPKGIFKKMFGK